LERLDSYVGNGSCGCGGPDNLHVVEDDKLRFCLCCESILDTFNTKICRSDDDDDDDDDEAPALLLFAVIAADDNCDEGNGLLNSSR